MRVNIQKGINKTLHILYEKQLDVPNETISILALISRVAQIFTLSLTNVNRDDDLMCNKLQHKQSHCEDLLLIQILSTTERERCGLEVIALVSGVQSPHWGQCVVYLGKVLLSTQRWGQPCYGLASHTGGVEILLVAVRGPSVTPENNKRKLSIICEFLLIQHRILRTNFKKKVRGINIQGVRICLFLFRSCLPVSRDNIASSILKLIKVTC